MEQTPISANSFLFAGFYPWAIEDKPGNKTTQGWRRKLFLPHTPSGYMSAGGGVLLKMLSRCRLHRQSKGAS